MEPILEMLIGLIGCGVRYLFFKLIGRKKNIEYFSGKTQENYNLFVGILTIVLIIALIVYILNYSIL